MHGVPGQQMHIARIIPRPCRHTNAGAVLALCRLAHDPAVRLILQEVVGDNRSVVIYEKKPRPGTLRRCSEYGKLCVKVRYQAAMARNDPACQHAHVHSQAVTVTSPTDALCLAVQHRGVASAWSCATMGAAS
jgi:hypothetical protein